MQPPRYRIFVSQIHGLSSFSDFEVVLWLYESCLVNTASLPGSKVVTGIRVSGKKENVTLHSFGNFIFICACYCKVEASQSSVRTATILSCSHRDPWGCTDPSTCAQASQAGPTPQQGRAPSSIYQAIKLVLPVEITSPWVSLDYGLHCFTGLLLPI